MILLRLAIEGYQNYPNSGYGTVVIRCGDRDRGSVRVASTYASQPSRPHRPSTRDFEGVPSRLSLSLVARAYSTRRYGPCGLTGSPKFDTNYFPVALLQ